MILKQAVVVVVRRCRIMGSLSPFNTNITTTIPRRNVANNKKLYNTNFPSKTMINSKLKSQQRYSSSSTLSESGYTATASLTSFSFPRCLSHHHQKQRWMSSSSSAMTLNYEVIGPTTTTNNKVKMPSSSSSSNNNGSDGGSILFLHGLLGNGRNLKTFAKKVCELKGAQGFLVDLRGHGKSRRRRQQQQNQQLPSSTKATTTMTTTFDDCIHDIKRTISTIAAASTTTTTITTTAAKSSEETNNTPHHYHPHTFVGHSWGGRMALQYAATATATATTSNNNNRMSGSNSSMDHHNHHHNLQRVWLLDTVPGQANESVEKVIKVVSSITTQKQPYKGRKQLVVDLQSKYGIDLPTSQWLASSYKTTTNTTTNGDFGFDLDVINDILPEFGRQDFFGLLETAVTTKNNIRIDLVRGMKNNGWNDNPNTLKDLSDFQNEYPNQFVVHELHNAGHWVHVDDLHGLVNIIR